ncbi:MAG: hypothetical protein ACOCUT_04215, partial [bacterium]
RVLDVNDKIRKLTSSEIKDRHDIDLKDVKQKILVIENIDLTEHVIIKNIPTPLLVVNSTFIDIEIAGEKQNPIIFFKHIKASNIVFDDCQIGNFYLKGDSFVEKLIISKCTFNHFWIENIISSYISINNSKTSRIFWILKSHIKEVIINNAVHAKSLYVNNSCFDKISISNNVQFESIVLSNSHVKSSFSCYNNIQCIILSITDNSRIHFLTIGDSCHIKQFNMDQVRLKHMTFKDDCIFDSWRIKRTVVLNIFSLDRNTNVTKLIIDHSFISKFSVNSSKLNEVNFNDTCFGNISLKQNEIGNLKLRKSIKAGYIIIEKCQISFINLIESIFSLFIKDTSIKLGYIDDSKFHRIDISRGSEFEIYLKRCQINWLTFTQTTLTKNSLMSLSEGSIYCIEMDEFTIHGDLHLRKIDPQDGCFKWWWIEPNEVRKELPKGFFTVIDNQRREYLKGADELMTRFNQATIKFSHSTLGRTEFTNCKLGDFQFEFNNSRITDCFISGGTIPSKNIVIIDDKGNELDTGNVETHSQKASIYNQFKKIFESQGDAYRAAQFQAKWAEHQKLVLEKAFEKEKKSLNLWKIIRHLKNEKAQDISIFWFNQKSNRHGEDWFQAVKFILAVSIPTYILFLTFSGRCFTSEPFDCSLIGYYFEFLNPVRKASFINDIQPPSIAVIVDFIARLFIAYGLYQFIAAFRKHGRKK